jgi:REP element-mobilizing transposase RayT
MARPVRIQFPHACYHVIARSNERKRLFWDDEDYQLFLKTLAEAAGEFSLRVHAYCLMPNHYHLLAETPKGNLSQAIGWLQTTFTIRYNRKHRRNGHLFQGRFKAQLIDTSPYARVLIPYVHLNPVRSRKSGKITVTGTWSDLQKWKWSSHAAYTGAAPAPEWLHLDWLGEWAVSRPRAQRAYREGLKALFGEELADPFQDLREGLVLGGKEFWEKAKQHLKGKDGRDEGRILKRTSKDALARKLEPLWKTEPDKRWQLWIRARLGGERKVDLAQTYGYRSGAAVLEALKRLEKRCAIYPDWEKKRSTFLETLRIES